jgi:hypothetical protein
VVSRGSSSDSALSEEGDVVSSTMLSAPGDPVAALEEPDWRAAVRGSDLSTDSPRPSPLAAGLSPAMGAHSRLAALVGVNGSCEREMKRGGTRRGRGRGEAAAALVVVNLVGLWVLGAAGGHA